VQVYYRSNVLIIKIDDVIGSVLIDANLLTGYEVTGMSGWFPIHDSLRGLCGEIFITIKVSTLQNVNQFKDSSPGIQFFSTPSQMPIANIEDHNSEIQIFGMVEELLIDDDPEHDWRDRIRSSRASNEQRQLLLYKLSGRIRRLIGKKVQDAISVKSNVSGALTRRMVLGYSEHFDLEDENIIVRGMGTQCRLIYKVSRQNMSFTFPHVSDLAPDFTDDGPSSSTVLSARSQKTMDNVFDMPTTQSLKSPIKSPTMDPNLPPQSIPETVSEIQSDDVIFCTMRSFSPGQMRHMAGVVQARAIKVLSDKKLEELGKERDSWWQEIRQEIRENARLLSCTHVVGYTEKTYIHSKGNICILSAEGTAAIIDTHAPLELSFDCACYHIPDDTSPFSKQDTKCRVCNRGRVPEILLSTCELPNSSSGIFAKQHFIEARIYRPKKRKFGESNGKRISQILPFAEYDLHKQLLYKMKLYHVNAIFNLSYNLAVSDFYIIVTVHGTGVHLPPLPESSSLEFKFEKMSRKLNHVHQQLQALSQHFNNVELISPKLLKKKSKRAVESDDESADDSSTDENSDHSTDEDTTQSGSFKKFNLETEMSIRKKNYEPKSGYLVEIDDETDEDNMIALMDPLLPTSITLCNFRATSSLHLHPNFGQYNYSHLQNIVIQKRYSLLNRIPHDHDPMVVPPIGLQEYLSALYHDLYTTLAFKLQLIVSGHDQRPVKVCGLSGDIGFTSDHEVLISLQCMAIVDSGRHISHAPVDQIPELLPIKAFMPESSAVGTPSCKQRDDELFEMELAPTDTSTDRTLERENAEDVELDLQWASKEYVTITPLYFVPGARVKTVLGKVSQHLIRESESVLDFGTFQQEVIMEANAVIRAHTKALGANALLNYQIVYHKVVDNPARKQAYTLLTVSGDAAIIEFDRRRRSLTSSDQGHFGIMIPTHGRHRSTTIV
jgi:uncharacterized protein YbjQ (UPF0145 family)